jgi:hypothetical protein
MPCRRRYRTFGAIANHGRAEGGVIMAVLVEDPLHDDFAPLMFKIDVDVRRLVALLRVEALEQQVVSCRINRGDTQDVADSAIRGAAAALAKNVLRPRKANDCMDGQEVRRVTQLLDEIDFVAKRLDHVVGKPLGIPPGGPSQVRPSNVSCGLSEGSARSSGYW